MVVHPILPPLQQPHSSPPTSSSTPLPHLSLPSTLHLIDLYHSHHQSYHQHALSSLIPPSLIPAHYHKTESTPLFIHQGQVFNEQNRSWETDIFPHNLSSKAIINSRAEVYFLAQTFEHMYNQISTSTTLTPNLQQKDMIEKCAQFQNVFHIILMELVRQNYISMTERGFFMHRVVELQNEFEVYLLQMVKIAIQKEQQDQGLKWKCNMLEQQVRQLQEMLEQKQKQLLEYQSGKSPLPNFTVQKLQKEIQVNTVQELNRTRLQFIRHKNPSNSDSNNNNSNNKNQSTSEERPKLKLNLLKPTNLKVEKEVNTTISIQDEQSEELWNDVEYQYLNQINYGKMILQKNSRIEELEKELDQYKYQIQNYEQLISMLQQEIQSLQLEKLNMLTKQQSSSTLPQQPETSSTLPNISEKPNRFSLQRSSSSRLNLFSQYRAREIKWRHLTMEEIHDLFSQMKTNKVRTIQHNNRWVNKIILELYQAMMDGELIPKLDQIPLKKFIYDFYLLKFGLGQLALNHLTDLMYNIELFYETNLRIQMFCHFTGLIEYLNIQENCTYPFASTTHNNHESFALTVQLFCYAKQVLSRPMQHELEEGSLFVTPNLLYTLIEKVKSPVYKDLLFEKIEHYHTHSMTMDQFILSLIAEIRNIVP